LANFKLTISDKKGKSITKELKEGDANPFVGLTIGSEVDAATVGLSGKLKVTGGSDKSGVPMRADIHSSSRKYVLLSKGVGLDDVERGERIRKLIRGKTVSEEIYQINCSYDGEIKIEKEPEASTEEPTKDAPKKDDSPKKEVKDAPKKDDSPKKEVKDAPKKDDSPKKEVKKESKKA
jgi:small subunit ribosomal protein S6e